ncbi:2-octaprenyl-6-methoxyphenol hydroxylase [Legionella quinlivanii]|uniref:2-octaprenyl-6-methoxyphenol hydroxylase n=1 Tax=Legionella quinlivanii TaxID=45073 RepID=A0A0W0Y5J1_9GAMM|nr:FAD-dependent monooxygenase [Legionella quinlivanii]KTD52069.1 2-octaprenyl-6-methoxyphenol hydroxylase [Legionella quinlivanii]MCW8452333.1 FAD-dependent monooxygenase [Legionella quinlivanii]SEF89192.1 2-octaprenyl-6-methoxyphenol hydroxylase [Legionella quinlivanii DSM 21216]STY12435.1 2-octaprenyl-6-methoxyphenol hydroxylase [Legionella quinlivanii]
MNASCKAEQETDILIVGGGLAGAALLLALADSGYRCLLIEAQCFSDRISPEFDARTLALSPASIRILQMLQVWPRLQEHATAIEAIYVSEQSRFGGTRLFKNNEESLGSVIEMQHINQALHAMLDKQSILAPARLINWDKEKQIARIQQGEQTRVIKTSLLVAADGINSSVRRLLNLPAEVKDYHQVAVAANIGLARSHAHCAYERFTATGPMAMLPMSGQRSSLIWAMPPAAGQELMALDDKAFLQRLQKTFGYKLGRFIKAGKRHLFPLQQAIMPVQIQWPVVFVGNAAHTLHPVAGQGFNLGLRDVAALAQLIIEKGLNPPMLTAYQSMRRYDQNAISWFTDGLVELFTSRLPGVGLARRIGLLAMDNSPILQKLLTYHARGFSGQVPDLACGIGLNHEKNNDRIG